MGYVVFFDLDDTVIKGQSQKFLIKYLFKNKKIGFFLYSYVLIWFIFYKLGLVQNVIKIREKVFKFFNGWSEVALEKILTDFFNSEIKKRIYKKIFDILNYHKERGAITILLSASIYPLVKIISDFLEMDFCIATKLQKNNGFYSGTIEGNVIYGAQKKQAVLEFLKEKNLSLSGSYAYGDHLSDLHLLSIVENPFIVNPDKYMEKIISQKNLNKILLN